MHNNNNDKIKNKRWCAQRPGQSTEQEATRRLWGGVKAAEEVWSGGRSTQAHISPSSSAGVPRCLRSPRMHIYIYIFKYISRDWCCKMLSLVLLQSRCRLLTVQSCSIPARMRPMAAPFLCVMVPLCALILPSVIIIINIFFLQSLSPLLTDSLSAVDGDAIFLLTEDYWSVSRAQAHWRAGRARGGEGWGEGGRLRSRDLNKTSLESQLWRSHSLM